MDFTLFGATLAATAAALAAVWLLSLALRDAGIVDIFWGPGFVLIAWVAFAVGDGAPARKLLVAGSVTLWGLRLGGYLAWRSWGAGEDFRYRAMRRRQGRFFPLLSLVTVFGLQGAIMWVVSLPVQVAQAAAAPAALGGLDALGVIVFGVGLAFEAAGDWQLARFKADPGNAGRVMDRGLWRYTRHPNYFGDFLVWWGLFAIAASTPYGWLTALGPAVMTFFLMRVSGVPMLERSLVQRRPGYADYVARTSAFFPRPPR